MSSSSVPVLRAAQVYKDEPSARSFMQDLYLHLIHGYVFSTPDVFVMGRPVDRFAQRALIVDPTYKFDKPDAWLVYLGGGDGLRLFFKFEPYELPYIGWERQNALRFYRREHILAHIRKT